MNVNEIANFIKSKRKQLGMTQEELAEKLFVTEKAVSRWETSRGTPDISLLIPLSKELKVDISELLCGKENNDKNNIEKLIKYEELNKSNKYNSKFRIVICSYILSILLFLIYLKFEYNPNYELNYFIRLLLVVISSLFIIIGNKIYENNLLEKLEDKRKITKISLSITFIYYTILMFNMVVFARYISLDNYNIIPFRTIIEIINSRNIYSIIINIFGNIFVFMPLEYFIINFFKINKILLNFVFSFIIIVIIELMQLIFKVGIFDIDDIILCTLGMMLFYIIYNHIKRNKC